jgi:hypothetical protein
MCIPIPFYMVICLIIAIGFISFSPCHSTMLVLVLV